MLDFEKVKSLYSLYSIFDFFNHIIITDILEKLEFLEGSSPYAILHVSKTGKKHRKKGSYFMLLSQELFLLFPVYPYSIHVHNVHRHGGNFNQKNERLSSGCQITSELGFLFV